MNKNGFTLIELAIALMVIGLLIGGVLKGQELIENAKITSTIRQIKAYETATMIFRNTYNALPGDIHNPGVRVPNCTTDLCTVGGNRNGKIQDTTATPPQNEWLNFFPHLTKAGMIQGPEGGTIAQATACLSGGMAGSECAERFIPMSVLDGTYVAGFYIRYADDGTSVNPSRPVGHYYQPSGMHCKYGMQLDTKLDDGNPARGSVTDESGDCHLTSGGITTYNLTSRYSDMEVPTGF